MKRWSICILAICLLACLAAGACTMRPAVVQATPAPTAEPTAEPTPSPTPTPTPEPTPCPHLIWVDGVCADCRLKIHA